MDKKQKSKLQQKKITLVFHSMEDKSDSGFPTSLIMVRIMKWIESSPLNGVAYVEIVHDISGLATDDDEATDHNVTEIDSLTLCEECNKWAKRDEDSTGNLCEDCAKLNGSLEPLLKDDDLLMKLVDRLSVIQRHKLRTALKLPE